MKKISHIAIIAPSFPKKENQGIIIPPLQLYILELKKNYPDIKVSIVALHLPYITDEYTWNGCSVYPINARNSSMVFRPFYWWRAFRVLKKIHRAQSVDLVHSFWLHEPSFIAQRFSAQNNIPHIATLMGQDAKPTNRYIPFISLQKSLLVCLSEFQKSVFEAHAQRKIDAVIPFGISPLDPDMPQVSANRTIDLIAVSSLIPLKRLDRLIESVKQVKEKKPNIQAVIVGEGPLRLKLEQTINESRLSKTITLVGQLDRKSCLEKMNSARILVHTSEYEGQGYVVNEALALGCKVVSMNKSIECSHPSFSFVDAEEALAQKILNVLEEENPIREPVIPYTMLQSLDSYERLVRMKGITFKQSGVE